MKRETVKLEDVVDFDHLAWAFWRASRGKKQQADVRAFAGNLGDSLSRLRKDVLEETVALGIFHRFQIRDPKPRVIHAPCFRERVLHHALTAKLEPAFERAHVNDTFACRPGRGTSAAIRRAQEHSRRWPWFAKLDVRSYFASIDHGILKGLIRRRIRGNRVLRLIDRIVDVFESTPGRGLPIGALTSQHFANLYLAPLDRFVLEDVRVPGMVRYMDDYVLWHRDRASAASAAETVRCQAWQHARLEIKRPGQVGRSDHGVTFCGFRVFGHRLGLTARRRRRWREIRRSWEGDFERGLVDDLALQAGTSSAVALVAPADALSWRRLELSRRPPVEA